MSHVHPTHLPPGCSHLMDRPMDVLKGWSKCSLTGPPMAPLMAPLPQVQVLGHFLLRILGPWHLKNTGCKSSSTLLRMLSERQRFCNGLVPSGGGLKPRNSKCALQITSAYFSQGDDEDLGAYSVCFSEFKAVGIPVSRSNSVLGILEDGLVMWQVYPNNSKEVKDTVLPFTSSYIAPGSMMNGL